MFIARADFVWHTCVLPIWSKIEMLASNIGRRFCVLPSPRYTERRNYAILELTSRGDEIPGVDEKKAGVLLCKAVGFIGMDTSKANAMQIFAVKRHPPEN